MADFSGEIDKIENFLNEFEEGGSYKYLDILKDVKERKQKIITILLDDILELNDEDLYQNIASNSAMYVRLFYKVIDKMLGETLPEGEVELDDLDYFEQARLDVVADAQKQNNNANAQQPPTLPAILHRRYELVFQRNDLKPLPLRQIASSSVGHLVQVRGVVIRISEVKPKVVVQSYLCSKCNHETLQEVNGKTYTPEKECPIERCRAAGAGKLQPQTRGTVFVKHQEIRLQEPSSQVPIGHTPRLMTCHLEGELTRTVSPGEMVTISGIWLPSPYTGFAAMRSGLKADTYLLAHGVEKSKKTYDEEILSEETIAKIQEEALKGNIYGRLAESIAPEIFGHNDVKKALLLLLTSGVTKKMPDGMKIRGDINVCLMGDPGVAKSQLLKFVAQAAPRGVYTTGKGSSGVGLTAAVLRDPITKELFLEGGALVLSDNGVCAIDEFDKMDDADKTAIHEVMEQQTISIAKAGITTTLNARSSILAAANPAYGRYNSKRSPSENINLPAALLSRFDLLFLLLDTHDVDKDKTLARHIGHVHRHGKARSTVGASYFDAKFIREYITQARTLNPIIPRELTNCIAEAYVDMRGKEANATEHSHTYTTARSLLGIIRISQALARLRFSETVDESDVQEAIRLMQESKASLQFEKDRAGNHDALSSIYDIILQASEASGSPRVRRDDIEGAALARGHTIEEINNCLDIYAEISVWKLSDKNRVIEFISNE